MNLARTASERAHSPQAFAVIVLDAVWHVGDFAELARRAPDHLPVSWCPNTWQRVAPIPGPIWRLEKPHAHFLDLLALTARERDDIVAWGFERGLVTTEQRWEATVGFDDETDDRQVIVCTSESQALRACAEHGQTDAPVPISYLVATDQLKRACQSFSDSGWRLLPLVWGQAHGLDGIWRREPYRPHAGSFPHGYVFRERASEWARIRTCLDETEEEHLLNAVFPTARDIVLVDQSTQGAYA